MFYCDACGMERGYPKSPFKIEAHCEICGQDSRSINEFPTSMLHSAKMTAPAPAPTGKKMSYMPFTREQDGSV
jgi:hypothetical protein